LNEIKEIPDEKLKRTILEKFNASISKDDNPITISRKISIVLSEIYQSEIQTAGLNLNKDPNYKGIDKIFFNLRYAFL
jgi:intein/homing endonuclease